MVGYEMLAQSQRDLTAEQVSYSKHKRFACLQKDSYPKPSKAVYHILGSFLLKSFFVQAVEKLWTQDSIAVVIQCP